LYVAEV
jgi:hypothetical protein